MPIIFSFDYSFLNNKLRSRILVLFEKSSIRVTFVNYK